MTAFDNFQSREITIWPAFICYGVYNSVQAEERPIIFGIYSNSYINSSKYLQGVSDFQLALILSDYNVKIAALSIDEQVVVASLAAKKYISDIEEQMHDEEMITKQKKINASIDEWDAKIAALSADRAALATLRVKIDAGIKKNNARISELEAYIQIEGLNFAMVDIEIKEKNLTLKGKNLELVIKELDNIKKDVALLEVMSEITKVQTQIVESAFKLSEVNLSVSRANLDTSQVRVQIEKTALVDFELALADAKIEMAEAERRASYENLDIAYAEFLIAEEKTRVMQDEVALATARTGIVGTELAVAIEKSGIAQSELLIATYHTAGAYFDADTAAARLAITEDEDAIARTQEKIADDKLEIANKMTQVMEHELVIQAKMEEISDSKARIAGYRRGIAETELEMSEMQTRMMKEDELAVATAKAAITTDKLDVAVTEKQMVQNALAVSDKKVEIAGYDLIAAGANTRLISSELTTAIAETGARLTELSTYASKLSLSQAETALVNNEIVNVGALAATETDMQQVKRERELFTYMSQAQHLTNQTEKQIFNSEDRDTSAALSKVLQGLQNTADEKIDTEHIAANDARVDAASVNRWAAITATSRLMTAEVVSSLVHTISKA